MFGLTADVEEPQEPISYDEGGEVIDFDDWGDEYEE